MAIQRTNIFLVNLHENNVREFFSRLFTQQMRLETLNPTELGDQWNTVYFTHLEQAGEFDHGGLDTLRKVINKHLRIGFLESFEDVRGSIDLNELRYSDTETKNSIDLAQAILDHDVLISDKKVLDKQRKKKKNLEKTEDKYQDICSRLSKSDHNLKNKGYDSQSKILYQETLKTMILVYTQLELEKRIVSECSNIFKMHKNGDNHFVFIAVTNEDSEQFKRFLAHEYIEYQKVAWNQQIVTWQNKKPLSAFQGIAQSLGTIGKHEFDPTLIVGFFFSLFFALSINDALYGLIISLFTGYFIYLRNLKDSYKNIFTLFFYSGLMSIFVGALSNSWGGDLFKGTGLGKALSIFQIIEPLEPGKDLAVNNFLAANGGISPIVAMLAFAVGIGLLHIFIAYVINVLNLVRQKKIMPALFETGWVVFLISLLASVGLMLANPSLLLYAVIPLVLGVIVLFIFNSGKTPIMKLAGGLIKMYDLVGFMADMLSYTRLIAVGLTGSIIAVVINLLAGIVASGTGPVVGFLLGLLVLVVGHTFNLIVSLFGAYINPLRLHYVEFMPKFYQGKARSLKPLNQDLTYAKLRV